MQNSPDTLTLFQFFEGQIKWSNETDPPIPVIQVSELRLNRDGGSHSFKGFLLESFSNYTLDVSGTIRFDVEIKLAFYNKCVLYEKPKTESLCGCM